MSTALLSTDLSPAQFHKIRQMLYDLCGINLGDGREELVKSRLTKRLRALNLNDFDRYLEYIEKDSSGRELTTMVDSLTTNKTSFFREAQHFEYLRQQILPKRRGAGKRIRLWSAGCSSGEEPFSLAILLREAIADTAGWDIRILATDISDRVLAKAREAAYDEDALQDVPPPLLQKYFTALRTAPPRTYRVQDSVRSLVRLAKLNLMGPWPMKGPFDVIFCRNVMIYFDKATQQRLVHRYWEMLAPGGHLFVGHSESLTTSSHEFRYVQPAVYVK